jgi:catechol 2,3-dioxygenase-like lactoylglutathione lyase family enzyme
MNKLYARSVFLVDDARRALRFYTEQLGFSLDWTEMGLGADDPRMAVFQVSLLGFELIVNQADEHTRDRVGRGRLFIGVEDEQSETLRRHLVATGIPTQRIDWGRPTLVVKDLDANELFFWLPRDDFTGLDTVASSIG